MPTTLKIAVFVIQLI